MKRDSWNRRYAERELVWSAGPNRRFADEVADLAPGRALDLACGEGRNALWLAERGWDVTAVDYSEVAIAKARAIAERRGVHPTLLVADVTGWEPDRAAYDLVLVLYLQLPVDELDLVLRRGAAALAPGGTFLLLNHDLRNLAEGHGGPQDPSVLTTAEQVLAALGDLHVERAEQVLREVEDAERPAIDVLVRASRRA